MRDPLCNLNKKLKDWIEYLHILDWANFHEAHTVFFFIIIERLGLFMWDPDWTPHARRFIISTLCLTDVKCSDKVAKTRYKLNSWTYETAQAWLVLAREQCTAKVARKSCRGCTLNLPKIRLFHLGWTTDVGLKPKGKEITLLLCVLFGQETSIFSIKDLLHRGENF